MGEPKPIMLDGELLEEAQALGIDIRQFLEADLRSQIEKEKRARNWRHENREFIESYNQYVERHGAFGEEWRSW